MNKSLNKKINYLLSNVGDMSLKRRAGTIVNKLELRDGDKVLDIGCGDGFYLHLLSNLNLSLELVGFDVSQDSLKTARKNLKKGGIKLVRGDLMAGLPFKDTSFDKIIMSEVAEHLPDDTKGLKEIYRVLKTGGILCLSVPSASYPFFWDPVNWLLEKIFKTHIKSGFWAGIWNQHLRLYTNKQIKNLLLSCNFFVEDLEEITFWSLPFNHYLVNFAARLFYSNSLNENLAADISKFSTSGRKKTAAASWAFSVVNFVDKLNDLLPMKEGVSIFAKAKKIYDH